MAVAISQTGPNPSKELVEKHISVWMWKDLDRHLGIFLRRDYETVMLAHKTTKDFLLQRSRSMDGGEKNGLFLLDHVGLAILCLKYLLALLPDLSIPIVTADIEYTFLSYAAEYWPEHYRLRNCHIDLDRIEPDGVGLDRSELESCTQRLLASPDLRRKWYKIFHANSLQHASAYSHNPTELEIASEFGLTNIAGRILNDKERFGVDDQTLRKSLELATKNSHSDIVENLVQNGTIILSALGLAACNNDIGMVKRFLGHSKHTQVDPKDVEEALKVAARNGCLEALRVLMEHLRGIPGFDVFQKLPLEEAADRGYIAIVAYLLEQLRDDGQISEYSDHNLDTNYNPNMLDANEQKIRNAFRSAASRGDRDMVYLLLEMGTKFTAGPFNAAVQSGHPEIVQMGIAAFKSQNQDCTSRNSDALLLASENGHLEVVRVILATKVAIDEKDANGDTALHKAVGNGHTETAKYLVARGASRNVTNNDDLTPSQVAAKGGHLFSFQAVQEYHQSCDYNRDILYAAENGHLLIFRYLFVLDQNQIDQNGSSLHWTLLKVAYRGHLKIVRELCEAGVYFNPRGRTISPLHQASSGGHSEVVQYLISKGADVNASTTMSRKTPLHQSVAYPEVVKVLLDNGADPEAIDKDDRTPLHLAVAAKDEGWQIGKLEESIQLLLDKGVDIEASDEDRNTALLLAAKHCFVGAFRALLNRNANATVANISKSTALHLAAEYGNANIVHLLMKKSTASIDSIDRKGKSPLHYAVRGGNQELLAALLAAGADINLRDSLGNTALNTAATCGTLDTVQLLLGHGADIELADIDGSTPLASTACFNRPEVTKVLLDRGADTEAADNEKWTPLIWAVKKDNLEVVKLLLDHSAKVEAASKGQQSSRNSSTSSRKRS